MKGFLVFITGLSFGLISCSSAKRGNEQSLSREEFEVIAPYHVKKDLEHVFQTHDWNASITIERNYRRSSADVVWVVGNEGLSRWVPATRPEENSYWVFTGKMPVMRNWIVKKGQWLGLQGGTQASALTVALQADLHRLRWQPDDKNIIHFVYEVVGLVQGELGWLLSPSCVETIDKVHHIEQGLGIRPADRTHEVIKPLCRTIKYRADRNGATIDFNYLCIDGVQEWRILFDNNSVQEVHVRTILKNAKLARWIPTG